MHSGDFQEREAEEVLSVGFERREGLAWGVRWGLWRRRQEGGGLREGKVLWTSGRSHVVSVVGPQGAAGP